MCKYINIYSCLSVPLYVLIFCLWSEVLVRLSVTPFADSKVECEGPPVLLSVLLPC